MHLSLSAFVLAVEKPVDDEIVARIEMEGFPRSRVMEVLEFREGDLKQAAVIVASLACLTAMRDEKLPRKGLPAPRNKP